VSAVHSPESDRTSRSQAARTALLWQLDKVFPANPRAFLDPDGQTQRSMHRANGAAGRYLAELGSSDVDVLDFGCGWGGETLWLANHARSVVGVDIEAAAIDQANRARAESAVTNCRFVQARSGVLPFDDRSFDAVFSTDTFEHVMDLDAAFKELFRVLRYWACQVPYAHLLCGLDAVLALRNARCDTPRGAATWQSLGLNARRFRDYKGSAAAAGFTLERFERIPVRRLRWLASIHGIGDLVTFGIDCRLRRPH